MLPEKNRIKKRKDFEEIFKKGDAFFGRFFILKIKKGLFPFSRFAFVFPIKKEKRAVERNKYKRAFREVLREILPLLKENIDGLFIIKKSVKGKKYKEIKKDIKEVFKKKALI